MHFLYFTRFKLSKIVQNPDWYNEQKFTIFLPYTLRKQNFRQVYRPVSEIFKLKNWENTILFVKTPLMRIILLILVQIM